ncbi:MAG: PIN domain-containing protein [Saprospiraceae bacterium]|jgi:predicted nucleic acid-binding protein|nr:PIN domain-containing protein [Saprospiraceae bacterium]
MNDKSFWDSNLWIYLFTESGSEGDQQKKQHLLSMLREHPRLTSSVQVLNEVANALLRKYLLPEEDVRTFLEKIMILTEVFPLTSEYTFRALELRQRFQLGWYDSLIVTAALESGCRYLFTEDMNHGLVVEKTLTIVNPFLDLLPSAPLR